MPIYEFTCQECNHTFEELLKISDREKQPPCPKCTSNNTKRTISSFGTLGGSPACSMKDNCGNYG